MSRKQDRLIRPISFRVAALVMLPLSLAAGLALVLAWSYHGSYQESRRVAEQIDLCIAWSGFVHELQKERGATSGYLSGSGEQFSVTLANQRARTDEMYDKLVAMQSPAGSTEVASPLRRSLDAAMDRAASLETTRRAVDERAVTSQDAIESYTQTNRAALDAIQEIAKLESSDDIARMSFAYVSFLRGKEQAGIERAVLSGLFARGRLDTLEDTTRTASLIATQEAYFDVFKQQAVASELAVFESTMTGAVVDKVNALREGVLTASPGDELGVSGPECYKRMTDRINLLQEIEVTVAEEIREAAHAQLARMATSLAVVASTLVACLGLVCVVFVWTMNRIFRPIDRANLELEQSNTEMAQFVYTASHDLKTPIVTIAGYIGYLRSAVNKGDTKKAHKLIERIDAAAARMHRTLEDLLELSRVGRGDCRPESVSLGEIAADVVESLRHQIDERAAVVTIADDLPVMCGDRPRLYQLFQTLVGNALEHGCSPPRGGRVSIGASREGSEVEIWVADDGPGIAPAYRTRVFRLFERLEADTDGTGVGLAIAKRVAEVHHGEVRIVETPGGGATVRVSLTDQDAA